MRSETFSLPNWKIMAAQLKLGIPIGLSAFFEVTSFTFMTIFISRLGEVTVSGHQIVANLTSLFLHAPALHRCNRFRVGLSKSWSRKCGVCTEGHLQLPKIWHLLCGCRIVDSLFLQIFLCRTLHRQCICDCHLSTIDSFCCVLSHLRRYQLHWVFCDERLPHYLLLLWFFTEYCFGASG